MKKLQQLEDLLNSIIEKIYVIFFNALKNTTPDNLKKIGVKEKLKVAKKSISIKLIEKTSKIKTSCIKSKNEAVVKFNLSKEKSKIYITKAKEIDLKKTDYKKIVLSIFGFCLIIVNKYTKWLIKLKPMTIASFMTVSTIVGVTSVGVYKNSKKIIDQSRDPASVAQVEKINIRPDYYKDNEKIFLVRNITIPVYLESVSSEKKHSMRKLKIDIVLLCSNKYIKAFFWEKPFYIHDKINVDLEPISIDFPLKEEGKKIIRKKIKQLSNELLKELHIKGSIKEVYLNGQVGA